MALSALDDQSKKPDDAALRSVLGRVTPHWHTLRSSLGSLDGQWNFAGAKYGWSLRLLNKKRIIIYMIPCRGFFLAGFVLGEKAVAAVHASGLPSSIVDAVMAAPRYAEGRGIRLEVRTRVDVENMKKLAVLKMET